VNSFDLLRLLGALLVIFHHVAPLSGEPARRVFSTDYGELGVGIFFVISGYLVSASWKRTPRLLPYLQKRLLRIVPGLVVSLLVTALALGAWATTLPLADYYGRPQTWAYVARNALLYPVTYDLPGVFADTPRPGQVNGSLWTLRLEFSCYLGLALLGLCRGLRTGVIGALAAVAAAGFLALHVLRPDLRSGEWLRMADLASLNGFLFLAGGWLQAWDKPARPWALIVSLAALATPLWPLGLPLVVVSLGRLPGVRLPADVSYGLYIYAFPLQQILAEQHRLSFWTALAVTLPFALASWFLVERPALRLKPKPQA
jgi:peptidoglycan/LPS O-acetylase OafA/YrhL